MKWPASVTLIRHDVSDYNHLQKTKDAHPLYQQLVSAYSQNPLSAQTAELAQQLQFTFASHTGDQDTGLAPDTTGHAAAMAKKLQKLILRPDVIFVSPYQRTKATLERMYVGWPELQRVKTVVDERIREQEHGLQTIYNDWRIFFALHPEWYRLRRQSGRYWFKFPGGENIPDVRLRNRDWLSTLSRDYVGHNVLVITHHLNILATLCNLERLEADDFLRMDEDAHQKPINLGVTVFEGRPELGNNGKLVRTIYNKKLY